MLVCVNHQSECAPDDGAWNCIVMTKPKGYRCGRNVVVLPRGYILEQLKPYRDKCMVHNTHTESSQNLILLWASNWERGP